MNKNKVVEIRKELREKKAAYHDGVKRMTMAEASAAREELRALTSAFSAAIVAGAKSCPFCGEPVIGIEHQAKRAGAFEYEVGCPACPAFEHSDGTKRRVAARGGVLPRHTVELWNEGPDHWIVDKPEGQFKAPIIGSAEEA